MRAIQTHLQAMLARGRRRSYVHCRAGIGRTGTVIGCYLAEQGLEGAEALRQLNQLWRQSARSASWPDGAADPGAGRVHPALGAAADERPVR